MLGVVVTFRKLQRIFQSSRPLIISVGFWVNLEVLTGLTETAFEALQEMKNNFHENFLQSTSETERQKYQYIIMSLSEAKPMTASGYFEVSRGTLTSMISVRHDIISKDILNN